MHLAFQLELHVTFENDDQFVGGVREVFPSLAGGIGPEIATETTCRPVGSNSFSLAHLISLCRCPAFLLNRVEAHLGVILGFLPGTTAPALD